jgi:hypothetical protein
MAPNVACGLVRPQEVKAAMPGTVRKPCARRPKHLYIDDGKLHVKLSVNVWLTCAPRDKPAEKLSCSVPVSLALYSPGLL